MVVLGVYRYGASFVPEFQRESISNGWVQVDLPCAQTGLQSSLGAFKRGKCTPNQK